MAPTRVRASLAALVALAPLALLAAACSRPPEQQFLAQYFRAARARDNTSLAMMSAVVLDPREQGEVTDFEITNVSDERRTPLDFKALFAAEQKAISPFFEGFWEAHGWGLGMGIVTAGADPAAGPSRFGWDGAFGTSWWVDPKAELVGVLLVQRRPDRLAVPPVTLDFWASAYQLLAP